MKLLTAAAVVKLKPYKSQRREVRDGGAAGLYLCIQTSGHKSWVLRGRRPDGRPSKVTLGVLDLMPDDGSEPTLGAPLTVRAARVLANTLLRQKAKGVDIAAAKIQLSRQRQGSDSFVAVAKEFIADHARPKNRTWQETARILGLRYVEDNDEPELKPSGLAKRWASKKIADIDGALIHGVIAESRRHGIPSESRGRAMAAALGKLFAWAAEHRVVAVNPCIGMFRPKSPAARSRVLTAAEIKAVWQAADAMGLPFGPVVKLLLLTGQRRQEVSGMRWSELSDDFAIWNLPPARTKNKQPHIIFMPPLARQIIQSVPRRDGVDLLFTTTGSTAISGFSKFKAVLDELMATFESWRLHDCRRSAVTGMAELGVSPHVIEAVVNHISGHKGGVAGIYNRASYAPEKKAALEIWADHVGAMVGVVR